MKKFVKISSIIALVFMIVGIVLVSICAFGGGSQTLRQFMREGRFNFGWGNWDLFTWSSDWPDKYWPDSWDEPYDLEDSTLFNGEYTIQDGGELNYTTEKSEVTSLKIELGGCDVYVQDASDGKYSVETSGSGKFQAYVKNGTLHVKGVKKSYQRGLCEVYIYIPQGVVLNEADISLGAGQMDIGYLSAVDVDIEVGAGALYVDEMHAKKLEMEVGAGEIIIFDGEAGNMDLSVGAGNMVVTGAVGGNIDAEVAMGNMQIIVKGSSQQDHNYDIECVAGTMTIGGGAFSGLGIEKYINNSAGTTYILEVAMGQLAVEFDN